MTTRLDLAWRLLFVACLCASACRADDPAGWTTLFEVPPTDSWLSAADASLAPDDPTELVGAPGSGVLISTRIGSKAERNLTSESAYGDVELELEFLLARGSNAGVKMQGLYELQLYDSYGVADPKGTDCGGIYPRAIRKPTYHHIDEGTPPKVNAAREPGAWQTVSIRFRAPRFDESGEKTVAATFEEVRINGQVVQSDAAVDRPTGAYWRLAETPLGPVYLQGDHGPVAYRNVRVRPLPRASIPSARKISGVADDTVRDEEARRTATKNGS